MRIIAYAYCADVHCPDCARTNADVGILTRKPPLQLGADRHGLAFDLIDREGNAIHAIYDIDEGDNTHCGDCLEAL